MFSNYLRYAFSILQTSPYIAASYSSEHVTSFLRFLIVTNFLKRAYTLVFKICSHRPVIDLIIGPNLSLPWNRIIHPYICLIMSLCLPTAGGEYFCTPCDLFWQWNINRCPGSKGLTYAFHGLAGLLCSRSTTRRAYSGFLPCLPRPQQKHKWRPEFNPSHPVHSGIQRYSAKPSLSRAAKIHLTCKTHEHENNGVVLGWFTILYHHDGIWLVQTNYFSNSTSDYSLKYTHGSYSLAMG